MRTMTTCAAIVIAIMLTRVQAQEFQPGIEWPEPPIVKPGETAADPPSDATVLFDGSDASHWNNGENWKVEDGNLVAGRGMIVSKEEFGDCQVHVEWSAPTPAKGAGQGRGNSGIFLMGRYEMQVLDSFENKTYSDGQAASIYKQTPPMVNAMRPPGEWNTYDIIWTCPRFDDDGKLVSPAYITALHNGVVVLNHFQLKGDTPFNRPPRYDAHPPKGPISIQDHGNPVRFRNIWVREIEPVVGEQVREPNMKSEPVAKSGLSDVKGQVTLDEEPIDGVVQFAPQPAEGGNALELESGRYVGQLPPGKYVVRVLAGEAARQREIVSPQRLQVEVADGDNTLDFDLATGR